MIKNNIIIKGILLTTITILTLSILSGCSSPAGAEDSLVAPKTYSISVYLLDEEESEIVTTPVERAEAGTLLTLSIENLGEDRKVLLCSPFGIFSSVLQESNGQVTIPLPEELGVSNDSGIGGIGIWAIFAPKENYFIPITWINCAYRERVVHYDGILPSYFPYVPQPHVISAKPGDAISLKMYINEYIENNNLKLSSPDITFTKTLFNGHDDHESIITFTMPAKDVYIDARFKSIETYEEYTCTIVTIGNYPDETLTFLPENPQPGDTVTVSTNVECKCRQVTITAPDVTFGQAVLNSCITSTTFIMPEGDVEITALFGSREVSY